jgi:hypothetical protein
MRKVKGARLDLTNASVAPLIENERVEAEAVYHKLQQDWEKQQHRHSLLEL